MHKEIGIANKREALGLCCQKLITDNKEAVAGKILNQPFQVKNAETHAHPKKTIRNGPYPFFYLQSQERYLLLQYQ